jgi:hypothetical protein
MSLKWINRSSMCWHGLHWASEPKRQRFWLVFRGYLVRISALARAIPRAFMTFLNYIRIVGMESKLRPLGTSATSGLLDLPRVSVRMETLVEWRLTGEAEVLGENLSTATLSTTNPTCPDLGANPGRRDGKPATNRLSYGVPMTFLSLSR